MNTARIKVRNYSPKVELSSHVKPKPELRTMVWTSIIKLLGRVQLEYLEQRYQIKLHYKTFLYNSCSLLNSKKIVPLLIIWKSEWKILSFRDHYKDSESLNLNMRQVATCCTSLLERRQYCCWNIFIRKVQTWTWPELGPSFRIRDDFDWKKKTFTSLVYTHYNLND